MSSVALTSMSCGEKLGVGSGVTEREECQEEGWDFGIAIGKCACARAAQGKACKG